MNHRGFTLIELLISLAIVGILIGLAYPSYLHYLTTANRTLAKERLLQLAMNLEDYYSDHNTYVGATASLLNISELEKHVKYELRILEVSDTDFTIEAIPNDTQALHDQACGSLILTNKNEKSITGNGSKAHCWEE